ncbi:MAG: DegT/DnrJ/EryC1/StrS family aminotransferase [Candidatus Tectimicrobiota bacterium]
MSLWKVPLADIDLSDEEIHAVSEVLRSKWLSMGPVTADFEQQFAALIGVKHAFAVTNCTAALHLAHLALGAGPGDSIICPSLTFVATANAIRYTGASPVFADVTSADNCNISPERIAACIDETTKGICVVHYGGYPCDMEAIMALARQHGLYVVEDAAHAPGAGCWMRAPGDGPDSTPASCFRPCGSIGDIGCFSFFSNKNLSTGEGGMLTTDNDALAERIKLLRSHGMTSLTWDRDRGHSFSYDVTDFGFNYRIDEMRSALGLVQLRKLLDNNQRRAEAVNRYHEKLAALPGLVIPFAQAAGKSSYHLMPLVLPATAQRSTFMQFLKDRGIQTSIHYPPIHHFTYYRTYASAMALPVTEQLAQSLVTLPLFPHITAQQIDAVVEAVSLWHSQQS